MGQGGHDGSRHGGGMMGTGQGMSGGMMGGCPMMGGMMGTGQGMGGGMMGQGMGMMGQGTMGCPWCGPGMMGSGYATPQPSINLTVNDVKAYLDRWVAGNPNIQVANVVEQDANTITADIVTKDKAGLVQRYTFDKTDRFLSPGAVGGCHAQVRYSVCRDRSDDWCVANRFSASGSGRIARWSAHRN